MICESKLGKTLLSRYISVESPHQMWNGVRKELSSSQTAGNTEDEEVIFVSFTTSIVLDDAYA